MKYLKTYEELNENNLVRCNWCEWSGFEDELILTDNDDDHELCPKCKVGGYIGDINTYEELGEFFEEYIKTHKPLPNINRNNFNSIIDYYKAAYPNYNKYATSKKYNL